MKRLAPIVLLLLAFVIILTFLVMKAPSLWYLNQLTLSPIANHSTTEIRLGYHALGQYKGYSSADLQHLKARFDADKGWLLSNVSPKKKVVAISNQSSFFLKRWPLRVGDKIRINRHVIQVDELNKQRITLRCIACGKDKADAIVKWQGNELHADHAENFVHCPDNTLKHKTISALLSVQGKKRTLFSIGGGVQCNNRWQLPTSIPLASAHVQWQNGHYWLLPTRQDVAFHFQHQGGKWLGINQLETPVVKTGQDPQEIIQRLIIGRSHYKVTRNGDALTLTPVDRLHLFVEKPTDAVNDRANSTTSVKVTHHWQQLSWIGAMTPIPSLTDLLQWHVVKRLLLILVLLLPISYLLALLLQAWWNSDKLRVKRSSSVLFAQLAVSVLSFSLAKGLMGENLTALLILLGISTSYLAYLLWKNQYFEGLSGRFWFVFLGIAGLGVVVQVQLAAGSMNSYWLHFPQGYIVFLLALFMLLSFMALAPTNAIQGVWRWISRGKESTIKVFYGVLLAGLGVLLVMQFASGAESGLGFLQPVEFIKLLLVVLLAKVTLDLNEVRAMNQALDSGWLWRFAKGLVVALVVSLSITFGVRDFSPLLIIAALSMAYLWIIFQHPVKPRWQSIWQARLIFIVLPLGVLVVLGAFLHASPDSWLANALPQTERFKIWANPWQYPDLGKQLQLSLEWVHEGGWFGMGWFGANDTAMNLPAVQDDFILAFLLYKFGGLMGLLLLIAQIAWLWFAFSLVQQVLKRLPNEREQRLSHALLAYILYGLAWMQLVHWLISWGNVLGLMPIMGQPMTWLSSGNSHLLAIALPSVLLSLVALSIVKQDSEAR